MGIAIAVIYLPLLAIISAIAVAISLGPIRADRAYSASTTSRVLAYISGGLTALALTSLYAWWYAIHSSDKWGPVIGSLAISLVGPVATGSIMHLVWMVFFRNRPSSFGYAVSGAWQSTAAMPLFGMVVLAYYDDVVHKPTFDRLCGQAGVRHVIAVTPATSFAQLGLFVTPNSTASANQGAIYLLSLPDTPLMYIENEVHDWNGKDRLVRITNTKAPSDPSRHGEPFAETPIDALSADYQVIPKKLAVPESLAGRTYGQKIEVTRRADGKVIAETQYYWDKEKRWECPAGISDSRFIERFVADSLNLPVSQ